VSNNRQSMSSKPVQYRVGKSVYIKLQNNGSVRLTNADAPIEERTVILVPEAGKTQFDLVSTLLCRSEDQLKLIVKIEADIKNKGIMRH
jgi:hypothetical protein